MNELRHPHQGAAPYVPPNPAERKGIALCLSGGGFRAALFHLGGLRRLNELGILSQVNTISAVSGGSTLAAHLAAVIPQWPEPGEVVADWDEVVAIPFRAFTASDARSYPLRRRLRPWNWFKVSLSVETLADRYEKTLTNLLLSDLQGRKPRIIFCATDLAFGDCWVFDSGDDRHPARAGSGAAGFTTELSEWPVARAVAASSCFPPMFGPMPLHLGADALTGGSYHKPDREKFMRHLHLSDGGVYDTLGLEPVWKDHEVVLVSDGWAPVAAAGEDSLLWRLNRYQTIPARQWAAARKRWLVSSFITGSIDGAYWSISSDAANYGAEGYSAELVDEHIEEIRTDLDAFSESEQMILENHGYFLAEAAAKRHQSHLIKNDPPMDLPHPQFRDEATVAAVLADSSRRVYLRGRQQLGLKDVQADEGGLAENNVLAENPALAENSVLAEVFDFKAVHDE